ncbi:hypothetical protein [Falsiroseomonas sp. E2-1-a20]|uniref:hypothetical protein n=1 Tax=Falsiroseomonas sp. E2-1-a20 TaxID=3239300 RepID=UPI003F2F336F
MKPHLISRDISGEPTPAPPQVTYQKPQKPAVLEAADLADRMAMPDPPNLTDRLEDQRDGCTLHSRSSQDRGRDRRQG